MLFRCFTANVPSSVPSYKEKLPPVKGSMHVKLTPKPKAVAATSKTWKHQRDQHPTKIMTLNAASNTDATSADPCKETNSALIAGATQISIHSRKILCVRVVSEAHPAMNDSLNSAKNQCVAAQDQKQTDNLKRRRDEATRVCTVLDEMVAACQSSHHLPTPSGMTKLWIISKSCQRLRIYHQQCDFGYLPSWQTLSRIRPIMHELRDFPT